MSTLVRAEVELARAEVTAEVKKGLQGSIFFIVALAVALFSLFFLFFTFAASARDLAAAWAAFSIVFGLMIAGRGHRSASSATCACARSASPNARSRR